MEKSVLKSKFIKSNHPLRRFWESYHWFVVIIGVIVVFILGIDGFGYHYSTKGISASIWDIFYSILQLFVLSFDSALKNLNWTLETARWLAPTIAAYTAGRALALIFSEQIQLFRLQFLRKHIIICGLGKKGLLLSRKFKEAGYQVVVIENSENNENLKQCRESGAFVLTGNAMEPGPLRKARLGKAAYLFCVCGDDGVNAGIAFRARELIRGKRSKFQNCFVHIVNPQLCRLLKEREFETKKNDAFRLEFFNLFDQAAKAMIETFSPFENYKRDFKRSPHLLIVGAGNMGESLIIHTARKWLDLPKKPGLKFKISILDRAAGHKKELIYRRYPGLEEVCQLVPLQMDIKSKDFEDGGFLIDENKMCSLRIIYICLGDDSFALSTALVLNQLLREQKIPIVVRMEREAGLAPLVEGDSHGFANIQVFGLLDRVLKPELLLMGTHEILARFIHQEYLRDQLAKGERFRSKASLVYWDELPEGYKDSNRRQADFLGVKLATIGCHIVPASGLKTDPIEFTHEEVELMAKTEHEHFMEERIKDGWRYGADEDVKRKISPVLVPWDELPEEEKDKDRNPVRNMPVFLAKAGFQVYRRKKKEEKLHENGRRVEHANCRKKDNNR